MSVAEFNVRPVASIVDRGQCLLERRCSCDHLRGREKRCLLWPKLVAAQARIGRASCSVYRRRKVRGIDLKKPHVLKRLATLRTEQALWVDEFLSNASSSGAIIRDASDRCRRNRDIAEPTG